MDVYWDLYLVTNLVINGALLYGTAILTGRSVGWARVVQGAAFGSAYGLGCLVLGHGFLLGWAGLLASASVMLWLTFRPLHGTRDLGLVPPLVVLAVCGGGVGLMLRRGDGPGSADGGGLAILQLLIIAASVLAVSWGARFWNNRGLSMRGGLRNMTITIDGQSVNCVGFVDTGNQLAHPITGESVIIVEYATISKIASEEWQQMAGSVTGNDLSLPGDGSGSRRFCIIPFRALGGHGGLLAGLRVDHVRVEGAPPAELNNFVVAVTKENIGGGEYQALIPAHLRGA